MRRVVALFVLFACRQDAVVSPVTVPLACTTAAPITREPASSTYDAFTSTDENEFEGWQILLARRDEDARVVVRARGSAALPVELAGTAKTDGPRVRVRASAGPTKDALRFDAVIDGDALAGVLHTDTGREEVKARRGVPKLEDTFAMDLGGDVDGRRIDVAWKQHGSSARVTVTDLASSRVLEGTMRDGRFTIGGDGVTMRGVFANMIVGMGEWNENGAAHPFTLDVMHVPIPKARALAPTVNVIPSERWVRGASGCPSSYEISPKISGIELHAESVLNRLMTSGPGPAPCTGESEIAFLGAAWSTSTYAITAARPGWFAFRRALYGYMGGAHGMAGETCDVAVLSSGKLVSLQAELSQASLVKLGPIVRNAILARSPGTSLVDHGFNADDPNVTSDRVMCAVEDHGALALEVVYQNEDPAGNFRFIDVRPHVPATIARALFPNGSAGALVFQ